ncbi:hypothetical protein BC832DRAFT_540167 [Gaertneriomyces semiglobifer]|nr:hypothetical protein BC832DRAFT_540167 [Gaertneriomyces semiglobifer]
MPLVAKTLTNVGSPRRALSPRPGDRTGSGRATRALIGRHSKDRVVSVFVEQRHVVSEDATGFPPLVGMVTVDPDAAKPMFADGFAGLGTTLTKILYQKAQELTEAAAGADGASDPAAEGTQPGRLRCPFRFEFEKDVPPTFNFDPSELQDGVPLGLHWEVIGFVGRQTRYEPDVLDDISMDDKGRPIDSTTYKMEKFSPASLNFQVENRHNFSHLSLPPMISTQTLRPSLFSFGRSQVETTATASIERPLCSSDVPLKVHVEITKLSKSQRVRKIRLTAKQILTIALPTQQQIQFKANIAIAEDSPAPRYDPVENTHVTATYTLNPGEGLQLREKKPAKCPARVMPLDWYVSSTLPVGPTQFVASTPPPRNPDDFSGVEVKYILKVEVVIADSSGTFGSRERELELILPFLLTGVLEEEAPPTAFPDQQRHQRRLSTSSGGTVATAPDALLPLLSETLDDLDQSIKDIAVLQTEWRTLRNESRNCILDTLHSQIKVFDDSYDAPDGAVRWPRNPVPFNMLVLETELLARAAPDALVQEQEGSTGAATGGSSSTVVDEVLVSTSEFFKAGRAVVFDWIASRGSDSSQKNSEEFGRQVALMNETFDRLKKIRKVFVPAAENASIGIPGRNLRNTGHPFLLVLMESIPRQFVARDTGIIPDAQEERCT